MGKEFKYAMWEVVFALQFILCVVFFLYVILLKIAFRRAYSGEIHGFCLSYNFKLQRKILVPSYSFFVLLVIDSFSSLDILCLVHIEGNYLMENRSYGIQKNHEKT